LSLQKVFRGSRKTFQIRQQERLMMHSFTAPKAVQNLSALLCANFLLHENVQTGSGAHSASYPMGSGGSFPGGKAARSWSRPLTSI